jgi:hypothetical protein
MNVFVRNGRITIEMNQWDAIGLLEDMDNVQYSSNSFDEIREGLSVILDAMEVV